MKNIVSEKLVEDIAGELDVDAIILLIDDEPEEWIELDTITPIQENKKESDSKNNKGFYTVTIKRVNEEKNEYVEATVSKTKTVQFDGKIAEIISGLIKKKLVKQDDKLLIITDDSLTQRYAKAMLVLDVNKTLYRIGKFKLAEKMTSETIIETIIGLAQEIGREGREGRAVGTLFIIGNPQELAPYCKQLIMNPFKGYEKNLLNIVQNQTLDETVKNFAQLDGAFIIDNEGYLLSAGTYLDVNTNDIKPFAGWGTKHLAATAITKVSSAIAVLVSESGGIVKVFKNGRLVLKLR